MSTQGLICHDYFAFSGGGENLAATMAEGLNFPLSAGFVNQDLELANSYPMEHIGIMVKSVYCHSCKWI